MEGFAWLDLYLFCDAALIKIVGIWIAGHCIVSTIFRGEIKEIDAAVEN